MQMQDKQETSNSAKKKELREYERELVKIEKMDMKEN